MLKRIINAKNKQISTKTSQMLNDTTYREINECYKQEYAYTKWIDVRHLTDRARSIITTKVVRDVYLCLRES